MEKKRAGSDRRSQSAVMYLVMAFSFCIFIWLLGTVKAPDVRFDSEKPVVITGVWNIREKRQCRSCRGHFLRKRGFRSAIP